MHKLLILLFTLLGVNLYAQKAKENTDFQQYNYQNVIQNNNNQTIALNPNYRNQRMLAIAYSQQENHQASLQAWKYLHKTYATKATEEDFLELYRELRINGLYTVADSINSVLQSQFNNQQFKRKFPIVNDSIFTVYQLQGNTSEGEYGLVSKNDATGTGYLTRISNTATNKSAWLGKPHFQIDEVTYNATQFQTKQTILSASDVHFEINHVDHHGNLIVTTNDVNKKIKRDFNPLSVQIAKKINDKWILQSLPINEKYANTAHFTISPNGQLAAFASDRKGSFGKTDIYLVSILSHTKDTIIFGQIQHLGTEINTPYRETHPVFQSDSILTFSSDGYAGFGGLDIFLYNLKTKSIMLFPAPINATGDDLHLIITNNQLYFTSNRGNSNYNDDLYCATKKSVAKITTPQTPVAVVETPAAPTKPVIAESKPAITSPVVPAPAKAPVTPAPAAPTKPVIAESKPAITSPVAPAPAKAPITPAPATTAPVKNTAAAETPAATTKPVIAESPTSKFVTVKIVVGDADNGSPLANQWIIIENTQAPGEKTRRYYQTDANGQINLDNFTTAENIGNYAISAEPCNYEFITSHQYKMVGDTAFMFLSPRQRKVGNSLASEEPQIRNIYYELDKYIITDESKRELNNLVIFLKAHPNIIIEITSHTDARGSDAYNLKLSQNRAKAAKDYIVAQGIDPKRVMSIGMGETQLLNRCANDVICSDEEHVINRRTEYVITKLNPCVVINKPTLKPGVDTDRDGILDVNEGFFDRDGDGIPNYLDPK
jgi:outer membrane protein OmpA-like peptidoglycan-associated protein